MSKGNVGVHPLAAHRQAREWSQAELALRAGLPRSSVSAIEAGRLTPSVTAALAVAGALGCTVEELFRPVGESAEQGIQWAWPPRLDPSRYWEAEVGGRRFLYPVESLALNSTPHDGVSQRLVSRPKGGAAFEGTLVVACCDPAAGLLAAEYARASGFRMIVLQRGGHAALDLLNRGLVHMAGLHRSTLEAQSRNAEAARAQLGEGCRLLRVADWQAGLALPAGERSRSLSAIARRRIAWAMRESGSAARECMDEALGGRTARGRVVFSHAAVAAAVRSGWAGAGVCVRISAEEEDLHFLPLRTESLDFVFAEAQMADPRIQAMIRLLRSRPQRRLLGELPGYDARATGELVRG